VVPGIEVRDCLGLCPNGIITLKDRALSPVAELFIANAREVARTRARGKW